MNRPSACHRACGRHHCTQEVEYQAEKNAVRNPPTPVFLPDFGQLATVATRATDMIRACCKLSLDGLIVVNHVFESQNNRAIHSEAKKCVRNPVRNPAPHLSSFHYSYTLLAQKATLVSEDARR